VVVDATEWGYLPDAAFVPMTPQVIAEWAENVIHELLNAIRDGKDVWSKEALDGRHDFLVKCLP